MHEHKYNQLHIRAPMLKTYVPIRLKFHTYVCFSIYIYTYIHMYMYVGLTQHDDALVRVSTRFADAWAGEAGIFVSFFCSLLSHAEKRWKLRGSSWITDIAHLKFKGPRLKRRKPSNTAQISSCHLQFSEDDISGIRCGASWASHP